MVDILCGYLRSDRTSYALDEFGNTVKDEFGRLVKSGSSDEAVESTILDMFAVHLRKERRSREDEVTVRQQVEDDQLWCDCRFDFHGTAFHGVASFAYSMFENETGFSDVTFEGTADFFNATFEGTDFSNAKFKGTADFSNATFNRKYRNATYPFYKWGPISIPPDNDGLPSGRNGQS
ncbi:pentapeptide repeat-containing protein [Bifidobacterium bifidum]|uniref:pentapeptide repeat-containing protein n=1 Tax=Bifidobacterium bifidum TaxID=1681 RepID=UPI003CFCAAC0